MTYPGGKQGAGVYQRIICQMPPHTTYVEGFLGGGAIMRLKRPAIASIGIDADKDVLLDAQSWAGTIPGLCLRHADAIRWLSSHAISSDTLCYLDPPYLVQTRKTKRLIYRCELTDDDHARLLAVIVKLDCMVAISGYWSEMYAAALHDWRVISFNAHTRGGTQATEWLWMNYPEPLELHDYSYLGDGYRERERIKRKKERWTRRLHGMPTLERHALMAAIDEMRGAVTPHCAHAVGASVTTPETARQPESATPDQAENHHAATPDAVMVHKAAPAEMTLTDPNAENGDGCRQTTAELTSNE